MLNKANKTLKYFIDVSKEMLSHDALEAVNHYFEHDEFEMCFEGLVIELMSNKAYPSDFNFHDWKKLAIEYHLNEHSVFDGVFWENFCLWGEMYDL